MSALASIVVPTYNRSDLATECVRRLQMALLGMAEIILSDDGSGPEHLAALEKITGIRLVSNASNRGLGSNNNQAFAAARTRYILYVQDDMFLGEGIDRSFLEAGIAVLENCRDIDIVRYQVPYRLAVKESRVVAGEAVEVYSNSILRNRSRFALVYSDYVHLRRSELCDRLGPYSEDMTPVVTELDYGFRVLRHRVSVATLPSYRYVFDHVGVGRSTYLAPSTRRPSALRRPASSLKMLVAYGAYRATGHFPRRMYR